METPFPNPCDTVRETPKKRMRGRLAARALAPPALTPPARVPPQASSVPVHAPRLSRHSVVIIIAGILTAASLQIALKDRHVHG
jgi:hypothetical protein